MTDPCRSCHSTEDRPVFCDLGYQPLANAYLDAPDAPEETYPLAPTVCLKCGLVQLPSLVAPQEVFGDYAYFSSQSTSWVKHVDEFAEHMIELLKLSSHSRVLEIASNDGATLRAFQERGIGAIGVEPAKNLAEIANERGLTTINGFMGKALLRELKEYYYEADLIIANNVLAHVPNTDDFLWTIRNFLSEQGTATFEFPDVEVLMATNAFDTIYHEHLSYLSLGTVADMFARAGLKIVNAKRIPTHGGSWRVYAKKQFGRTHNGIPHPNVKELLSYGERPQQFKENALRQLATVEKPLVGYGAAAKGTTLINYCDIGTEFSYVVDSTLAKQGKYLPGSRVPILAPSTLDENPSAFLSPATVWILPYNWANEIAAKLKHLKGTSILTRSIDGLVETW